MTGRDKRNNDMFYIIVFLIISFVILKYCDDKRENEYFDASDAEVNVVRR